MSTNAESPATSAEPVEWLIEGLKDHVTMIEYAREEVAKAKRHHKKLEDPVGWLSRTSAEDPREALNIAKGLRSGKLAIRNVECEVEVQAYADIVDEKGKRVGRVHGRLNVEGTYLEALDPDDLRDHDGDLRFENMSFTPRDRL